MKNIVKNTKITLGLVATVMLAGNNLDAMRPAAPVPAKAEVKTPVVLELNRRETRDDVAGILSQDPAWSTSKGQRLINRDRITGHVIGSERAGYQLVEKEFFSGYFVYSVREGRVLEYLAYEFKPGVLAFPLGHPTDKHNSSIIHAILKVFLKLSHTIKTLDTLEAKHPGAAAGTVEAQMTTREALDYVLGLPGSLERAVRFDARLIDGQNKMGINPAHLCVVWLDTDALAMVIGAGANIHIDNGLQRNLLHFLIVYLHDGEEYQRIFGAVTPEGIEAIKKMINVLMQDYKLPVIPEIRELFNDANYANVVVVANPAMQKKARTRTAEEIAMLRALPGFINEELMRPLLPIIKEALDRLDKTAQERERAQAKDLAAREPGHDTSDDVRKLTDNKDFCRLIAEYTI